MQSRIGHLVFNVQAGNLPFYRDLFAFLGWNTLYDGPAEGGPMLGIGIADGTSLWFGSKVKDVANDYDGPGLNHLAIGVETPADVDATVDFVRGRGIPPLFDTPRHRPEFSSGADQTYYQIMFETPDRILVEVVYTGPKPA